MSLSDNFPSARPALRLDFAGSRRLDPRVTFTRSTTATYFDGVTTAKHEENLVLQSQALDDAVWTKSNTAISLTNVTAPDGTATAEEVRDGTAAAGHNLFQTFDVVAGVTYALSCYLKNVDRQFATLAVSTGVSAWAAAKFDLAAGAVGSSSAAGSGWSVTSATITSVNNGWYRCALVFVAGASATANVRVGMATDGTTYTANGSGLESYTGADLKIAAWGAQFEQRAVVGPYTVTTTQSVTNYSPQLLTAAANMPRFDANPITGESLGLLIEESRTNLLTYSDQFDNAAWTKSAVSITANAAIAPDGTMTADKMVADTSVNIHFVRESFSATAGTYTASVFVKAAEQNTSNQLRLMFVSSANSANNTGSGVFDPVTGAWVTAIADGGTGYTGVSRFATFLGNGWWRLTFTATVPTETVQLRLYQAFNGAASNVAGDGYSGPYIWGAQAELAAFATSYIPTTSAQVTRAADAPSITGANFSSWFNSSAGTVIAEAAIAYANGDAKRVVHMSDGSVGNRFDMYFSTGSTSTSLFVVTASVTEVSATSGGITQTVMNRLAYAYATNDVALTNNGATPALDTSVNLPTGVNQMRLGYSLVTGYLNGWLKRVAYYNTRLPDAQLQALTL